MAKTEPCVLTAMCMVEDGEMVLVQDRCKPDWPGINFPGGHVEPGESFVKAAEREVFEETGLTVRDLRLCGLKQFTSRSGDYRYIVLFFKTSAFSGELRSSCEGRVFWVKKSEVRSMTLADGFESMLDIFESDDLSENYWYTENGEFTYKNL